MDIQQYLSNYIVLNVSVAGEKIIVYALAWKNYLCKNKIKKFLDWGKIIFYLNFSLAFLF